MRTISPILSVAFLSLAACGGHPTTRADPEVVDPGGYEILVGGSSADIRHRAKFDVTE